MQEIELTKEDWEHIDYAAKLGGQRSECIGNLFHKTGKLISIDTLKRKIADRYNGYTFSEYRDMMLVIFKLELRAAQKESAVDAKSVPMQKHLGEHVLDQTPKVISEGSIDITPVFNFITRTQKDVLEQKAKDEAIEVDSEQS